MGWLLNGVSLKSKLQVEYYRRIPWIKASLCQNIYRYGNMFHTMINESAYSGMLI